MIALFDRFVWFDQAVCNARYPNVILSRGDWKSPAGRLNEILFSCATAWEHHLWFNDTGQRRGVVIVAFDLETTGLSPLKGHRVIEVGAVRIEDNMAGETFQMLIDCGHRISKQARQIHGITDKMLKNGIGPLQAFQDFRKFVGSRPLVAHNAKFDKLFLQYEYSRFGWGLSNRIRCTMRLSRQKLPDLPNYRLETVARHLLGDSSLENRQAHRALDDAILTAQIWQTLEAR